MAESILLHIAEKLVDKLASVVVEEVSLAWGLKDELLKLRRTLVAISAVIADAEQRQSQERKLQVWLVDLKDVLYASEDVLDCLECEAPRRKVAKKGGFRGNVRHFFSGSNPVAVRFKTGHRVKEIQKRLDEITAMKDAFNLSQQPMVLLKDKKFLLVLDDVWNENRRQWNELNDLLLGGCIGSSVIVTTRSSKVASTVGTCYEHKLEGLSHESCMTLFKKQCDDRLVQLIDPEILVIAGEIVQKCGGVPLVVKALGGLLNSNEDVGYWRSIKDKDIFTVLQNEDDILPIIKLSYDHLPPHLKRCFHFCSLFPKDYQFSNTELCCYWKTVGLIDMTNNINNPDKVAEQYMKELMARSFFQDYEEFGAVFYLKMLDLVHDLAFSIAQNECSTVSFNNPSIPSRALHVSILYNTSNSDDKSLPVPSHFNKSNSRRTFMLRQADSGISKELLKACISSSKYLRILDLEGSDLEAIPSVIGSLRHLRLINLESNRRLSCLPSSICNLQSLQVLLLEGCESLEELPRDMWKLINLEYLSVTTKQRSLKGTGIENLNSLKYLWFRKCDNLESLFQETDVKFLTALQVLGIEECASLRSIPTTTLKFFTSLEVLTIMDCPELDISMDEEESFPLILRTIHIGCLQSISALPKWFMRCADTLESLIVGEYNQLEELPDWFGNFRHLKSLILRSCDKLASLPDGLRSLEALEVLEIRLCGELSERCQPNGPEWNKIAHIPRITIDNVRIR